MAYYMRKTVIVTAHPLSEVCYVPFYKQGRSDCIVNFTYFTFYNKDNLGHYLRGVICQLCSLLSHNNWLDMNNWQIENIYIFSCLSCDGEKYGINLKIFSTRQVFLITAESNLISFNFAVVRKWRQNIQINHLIMNF